MNKRERLRSLRRQVEFVKSKAEEEGRELTLEETRKIKPMLDEIEKLVEELRLGKVESFLDQPEPRIVGSEPLSYRSSTGPYSTLGEQLRDIAIASVPNGKVSSRLAEFRASGLNEGIPSEGGFLVQTDFAERLIDSVYRTGLLVSRCMRVSVSQKANGIKYPAIDETSRADGSRYGGVQVYNVAEASEKTASKPKFRQISIKLSKKVGLCYASDELIEDVPLLEQYIMTAFTNELAFKLDDEILNGSGASGEFLGILNSPALVTVPKESGQSANTIIWDNIVKMLSRFNGNWRSAVWVVNKDCLPQLFSMYLAIGTGGVPVYIPGNLQAGQPPTLVGIPVIVAEQAQTLGTKGDIYLLDLSQYIIADKGPMQSAVSIHVRFIYDESVFRFVYRCGGQPIWASAITPYKGSNTQSPFVTLATRS